VAATIYEDRRMYVFVHEKMIDVTLDDPYCEQYFPHKE